MRRIPWLLENLDEVLLRQRLLLDQDVVARPTQLTTQQHVDGAGPAILGTRSGERQDMAGKSPT